MGVSSVAGSESPFRANPAAGAAKGFSSSGISARSEGGEVNFESLWLNVNVDGDVRCRDHVINYPRGQLIIGLI